MAKVSSVSEYNVQVETVKGGMSVAFFSKPTSIVRNILVRVIFSIGVLFAVAALTVGCDRLDSGEVVRESSAFGDAAASSREAVALGPGDSLACSVNLIEPELKALFDLHQAARDSGVRCGSTKMRSTSSFQWSCELAKAADKHVRDMAKNGFMSHNGSDGSTVGQRATTANYIWRNVAENVAKGFEAPNNVNRVWLESPSHCENIMSPLYREMGAAKVGDYWVVTFGRR